MYEEITKYLKQFLASEAHKFSENQIDRLYGMLNYALEQVKPVQKYDLKDGLNK